MFVYVVTYSDALGNFSLAEVYQTRKLAERGLAQQRWKPCPGTRKKDWYYPNEDESIRGVLTIESRQVINKIIIPEMSQAFEELKERLGKIKIRRTNDGL